MRKPIQRWLFVLLIVVGVVFGVTLWREMSQEINRNPEISFDAREITVSVEDDQAVLLQGVVASDPEDGDVTESLVVESISEFQEDGTRQVNYAAFDSNGNVAKASRLLRYSDYHSPEIVLVRELKTVAGIGINLQECVQVEDQLDGNITSQIRVIESDFSSYVAGEYEITFQVTNSAGDTVERTFPSRCLAEPDQSGVTITLSVYSVILQTGESFNPRDYLDSVSGYGEDGRQLTEQDVQITDDVNTQKPGTYQVGYYLPGRNGTGTTRLIVIVE
ncbi:MAG: immunoglobulin-like domain-containing protein [Candidatus Onthomonas sp.]